ncbi:hypothetical protein J2128_002388 [Methanomicrobium sp. W14]|nr:hypothetical protein [Methanomicrobium sp. W14]
MKDDPKVFIDAPESELFSIEKVKVDIPKCGPSGVYGRHGQMQQVQ